ncbi:MAG: hypothetical protein M0026_19740 [Nocardiopsaceae bacterium]|nr:hypothetical protein [Nocardiopsaceae bacterium]
MGKIISILAKTRTAIRRRTATNGGDKGAGFVEYAGVLIVIGAIAAAVFTAVSGDDGIAGNIKEGIEGAVDKAFGEVEGAEGDDSWLF